MENKELGEAQRRGKIQKTWTQLIKQNLLFFTGVRKGFCS